MFMQIQEIAKMMVALREEKELSQEELCRGICSVTTLSRLEAGERRPDILIFNALLQRLGKSSDYINTILTLEEFEYFVRRRNVEIAFSEKDFEQAEKDLQEWEQEIAETGIAVHKQDIYRLYAYCSLQKENNYQKAEEYLYKAILETIPDMDRGKQLPFGLKGVVVLSETELELLLLYVYVREQIGIEEKTLLESLFGYIRSKITDEIAQNKALAQALYLQAYFYKKHGLWEKCYRCCEAAIEAEVKNGTMVILYQALKMEMECLEQGVMAQNGELRKKEYKCLKEVLEEYGERIDFNAFTFWFKGRSQEKGLIDEVVRFSRLRAGYSQEELSDGICTPETISRIETGKSSPTIKKFYAIMDKLGLSVGYYNTELVVEKFTTLQKINQLNRFNRLNQYDKAEELLSKIELEVDPEKNKQQLGLYHVVFDYRQGRISVEEALRRTEELLQLTLQKIDGRYEAPLYLSSIEIALLNQVAVYYRNLGRKREAVEILQLVYDYFSKSKVEAPEREQRYFIVIGNLASYLEEAEENRQAIEKAEESMRMNIRYNIGVRLGHNLIVKAFSQEKINNKNCLNNYKKAYCLCGLYEDFRNQSAVREQVLKNWSIDYALLFDF